MRFARAVAGRIQSAACIEPRRVHASGVASGGGVAYALGCDSAEAFAGSAPGAFDRRVEGEQPWMSAREHRASQTPTAAPRGPPRAPRAGAADRPRPVLARAAD